MEFRVSYPYQAIPSEQKFKGHSLCSDEGLVYIGTHFEHDVYVQAKGLEAGHIYCVYGKKEHEYYSAVGYDLVRTNKSPEPPACYSFAAACALLNNPQYIEMVLKTHR